MGNKGTCYLGLFKGIDSRANDFVPPRLRTLTCLPQKAYPKPLNFLHAVVGFGIRASGLELLLASLRVLVHEFGCVAPTIP